MATFDTVLNVLYDAGSYYISDKATDIYYDWLDGFPNMMFRAINNNDLKLLNILVSLGADIHVDNEASLKLASQKGYLNIVKYLVQHGAVINDDVLLEAKYHSEVLDYLTQIIRQRELWKEKGIKIKKKTKPKWQVYCSEIGANTNLQELKQISINVGLPIEIDNRKLSKRELCAQLAVQLEMVLQENYDHSSYCNNLDLPISSVDLDNVASQCLYKDQNDNCFYINDIIDEQGNLKLATNPYDENPWNFDITELQQKYSSCRSPSLQKYHKSEIIGKQNIQLDIVKNILSTLDSESGTDNLVLINYNIEETNSLISYFDKYVTNGENFPSYTKGELETIYSDPIAISMLAKFLSITRSKIGDDILFSRLIEQYLTNI